MQLLCCSLSRFSQGKLMFFQWKICVDWGKKVKLSLCLIKHHAMKTYGGVRYSFTILDLGTRWSVVILVPWPLYPWAKSARYALSRRLGGPQRLSGLWSREKSLSPARHQIQAVQPIAPCCTDWVILAPTQWPKENKSWLRTLLDWHVEGDGRGYGIL
jgi:hypothetical protein